MLLFAVFGVIDGFLLFLFKTDRQMTDRQTTDREIEKEERTWNWQIEKDDYQEY